MLQPRDQGSDGSSVRQLENEQCDPRVPSHYLAGLRSTYRFETEGNGTKMDEIWETVPMDVNAMPFFVLDESEKKEKDS